MDLSEKSVDELVDHVFRHLPDASSSVIDKDEWNACTSAIMEMRRRAIGDRDVAALGSVHILIKEMETVSQAIAFNAKRKAEMPPSLHVSGEVRA